MPRVTAWPRGAGDGAVTAGKNEGAANGDGPSFLIFRMGPIAPSSAPSYDWPYLAFAPNHFKPRPIMELPIALETVAVTLALLCIALVPVALRRDPGLARPIVRIDGLRRPRRDHRRPRG